MALHGREHRVVALHRLVGNTRVEREDLHVVLTGRGASDALIERADLVTEMKMVKHPYRAGICAQAGIEF